MPRSAPLRPMPEAEAKAFKHMPIEEIKICRQPDRIGNGLRA